MKLLEPLLINKLEIRNRIIMPAMETNLGNKKGEITEKLMKWYELRAKGGVGLIIVEPAYFEKRGSSTKHMLSISSDNKIEGFAKLTKLIKKYGAAVLLQIYHAGAQSPSMITKHLPVSPSGVPCINDRSTISVK
ncbi:NADH oxidase [subsurface metagenome]